MKVILIAALFAGCAGPSYQTLHLINKTDRAIPEIYFYPTGSANHGKPQSSLPPNGTAQVQVRAGRVEVLAVSAKVQIDDVTRDQPSATQDLELDRPLDIIFYDASHKPPGLERPGVIGVEFTRTKSNAPPANTDEQP